MLGSPVYGHLAGRLAEDPRPARAILGDGASWDLGLRLFGAVHYLVLTGVAPDALSGEWDDFAAALAAHEAALERFVREQGVQTNETQRCVALVPAFLTVAAASGLPLDLIELGPSAGLNLVFDRYGYRYAEGTFGAPDARLAFDAVERGRVPAALLETPIEVHSRVGHRPLADRRHGSRRRGAAEELHLAGSRRAGRAPRRRDRDVPWRLRTRRR